MNRNFIKHEKTSDNPDKFAEFVNLRNFIEFESKRMKADFEFLKDKISVIAMRTGDIERLEPEAQQMLLKWNFDINKNTLSNADDNLKLFLKIFNFDYETQLNHLKNEEDEFSDFMSGIEANEDTLVYLKEI